jgi:PKD repeat protein
MTAAANDALSATTISWDFGDGAEAAGTSVTHAYGAAGTYVVAVTATDAAGNPTTVSRTIVVARRTASGSRGGDGGVVVTPPDRTPPVASLLKSSNARFRVAGAATAVIAAKSNTRPKKTPRGTVFSLRLDERATLIFSVTGKTAGRRARKVAASPFIRAARGAGAVSVPFSGRLAGSALPPGSYRASVTAIDAAGNRSRPVTVTFTVVSR